MDFEHYSDQDQALGPVINFKDLVTLNVCGEAKTVDEFLHSLVRFWSIQPCSTIYWRTLDGQPPQPDEPALAMLAMKINRLSLIDEGDPNIGRKSNACSGQSA